MPDLQSMNSSSESNAFGYENQILDNRFRIDSFLGAGGVHRAFAAWDLLEQRKVCLKLPHHSLIQHEGFQSRYRQAVLKMMTHPSQGWLLPIALGEHDGIPFQALPFIEGRTLMQWYKTQNKSSGSLLRLIKTALSSLERLHQTHARIHGALKPDNFIITEDNEPIFCGLTTPSRLEDRFTEKISRGEPFYFSPEQLVGERAGPPSDLYSLALIIYEALTGKHAFSLASPTTSQLGATERLLSSLLSQLHGNPPSASSVNDEVPRWAERFLERCLRPRPEDRFSSASEALSWIRSRTTEASSYTNRACTPIGREQEMEFLLECLDEIAKDQPKGNFIRLHGIPGIGKTRCTNWLREQAKVRGIRVVEVRREPESSLHAQLLISALNHARPTAIPKAYVSKGRPASLELIDAAVKGPLLVMIDELTEADDTLIKLLEEAKAATTNLPLMVVLSEDGSIPRTLATTEFLESLDHLLILTPLDRRSIANLIEESSWVPPSANLAGWVHAVSQGHSLTAKILIEYLQCEGLLKEDATLDWATSPSTARPSLDELLGWKISRLQPASKALLENAAVLGDPFNLATLQALTYRSLEEVDEAIDEAIKLEILQPAHQDKNEAYSWYHPLYRQALLDALPLRRQVRVHRLAAAFYSQGEPEPAKLAYHFLGSKDSWELCDWGTRAAIRARHQGLESECNYWLNVVLKEIDTTDWLGPDLKTTEIELWRNWLEAYFGQAQLKTNTLTTGDPMYLAQLALRAYWPWEIWRDRVRSLVVRVQKLLQEKKTERERYEKALALLNRQWLERSTRGEPFPTESI